MGSPLEDAAKAAMDQARAAAVTAKRQKVAAVLTPYDPKAMTVVETTPDGLVVFTDGTLHIGVTTRDEVALVKRNPEDGTWTHRLLPIPSLAALGEYLARNGG